MDRKKQRNLRSSIIAHPLEFHRAFAVEVVFNPSFDVPDADMAGRLAWRIQFFHVDANSAVGDRDHRFLVFLRRFNSDRSSLDFRFKAVDHRILHQRLKDQGRNSHLFQLFAEED